MEHVFRRFTAGVELWKGSPFFLLENVYSLEVFTRIHQIQVWRYLGHRTEFWGERGTKNFCQMENILHTMNLSIDEVTSKWLVTEKCLARQSLRRLSICTRKLISMFSKIWHFTFKTFHTLWEACPFQENVRQSAPAKYPHIIFVSSWNPERIFRNIPHLSPWTISSVGKIGHSLGPVAIICPVLPPLKI